MKKRPKRVKKITFTLVASWVFGVLLFFGGIGAIIEGSITIGIIVLIGSIFLIPALDNLIREKFNIEISGGMKFVIIIACLIILSFISINESAQIEKSDTTETQELMKQSIVRVLYEVEGKQNKNTVSGSGVIFSNDNSKLRIFTNRHVVDCEFSEVCCSFLTKDCYRRLDEKITVRTQDGKIHTANKVLFAPHDLDIAILEIDTLDAKDYYAPTIKHNIKRGENIIAIGYPGYVEGVVEFSIAKGKIFSIKDLLMKDGFAFESIESDAYTFFGSSGGGLFDNEGNLIGINTWGNIIEQESIAIKLSSLQGVENSFLSCEEGRYLNAENKCVNYLPEKEKIESGSSPYQFDTVLVKNTMNGVTVGVLDYSFEKRGEDWGTLKGIRLAIDNYEGSDFSPNIKTTIGDSSIDPDKLPTDFVLLDYYLFSGEYIIKNIPLHLSINRISDTKEIRIYVTNIFGELITYVKFDVNLTEELS